MSSEDLYTHIVFYGKFYRLSCKTQSMTSLHDEKLQTVNSNVQITRNHLHRSKLNEQKKYSELRYTYNRVVISTRLTLL